MSKEIEATLKKQRAFFNSHKTKDISFRIWQLTKLKKALIENQIQILAALKADLNKPSFEAYFSELKAVLEEIDLARKNLKKWSRPEKVKGSLLHFPSSNFIIHEPLGVLLIIAPWNYPVYCALAPLVGALAAGNCAILKPSEFPENTSKILNEIISKTFDENYVKVFEGDAKVSKALSQEKFDHIVFTGSTAVGKIIMQEAAKTLTPVTLELGGKSPCIVDKDIKVDIAAKRIVWGKFFNAGQTCTAPDYLLVHKKIYKPFIFAVKKAIKDFWGQDPSKSEDYARIINKNHFKRIKELIDPYGDLIDIGLKKNQGEHVDHNSKIIAGGEINSKELYISPTVIEGVNADDAIMGEEIFGPVLPIIQYSDLNEALNIINAKSKPLALYIFSEDKYKQNYILNKTSSGGVTINDTLIHSGSLYLPFGGVGESGMGKYHGQNSFRAFSNARGVTKRSFLFDIPIKYAPYASKYKLFKKIFNIK